MHCPDCGFKISLKTDICPNCGSDFRELSEVRRKIVFNRPLKQYGTPKKDIRPDPSNVNGYVVGEGVSINGGKKLKKGARTSRSALKYEWSSSLGTEE